MDKDRRTGRSTRHIDGMVQELFKNGRVQVTDHHRTNNARTLHDDMRRNMRKILNRLAFEHHIYVGESCIIEQGDWIVLKN